MQEAKGSLLVTGSCIAVQRDCGELVGFEWAGCADARLISVVQALYSSGRDGSQRKLSLSEFAISSVLRLMARARFGLDCCVED